MGTADGSLLKGSSGYPKGVIGSHGAMMNRFRWMWEAFPFRLGPYVVFNMSLSHHSERQFVCKNESKRRLSVIRLEEET